MCCCGVLMDISSCAYQCPILIYRLLSQSEFCSDKPKSGAKYGLPEYLAILSEMGEVTDGLMDSKVSGRV